MGIGRRILNSGHILSIDRMQSNCELLTAFWRTHFCEVRSPHPSRHIAIIIDHGENDKSGGKMANISAPAGPFGRARRPGATAYAARGMAFVLRATAAAP
jgi:hypothetical protein